MNKRIESLVQTPISSAQYNSSCWDDDQCFWNWIEEPESSGIRIWTRIVPRFPWKILTEISTLQIHSSALLMLYVQVVRAAEEASATLAGSIHPEQCIKVLCPIVQTADYPINLAAIKMQSKVVERIAKESLHQLMPDIIPGLLQVRLL